VTRERGAASGVIGGGPKREKETEKEKKREKEQEREKKREKEQEKEKKRQKKRKSKRLEVTEANKSKSTVK